MTYTWKSFINNKNVYRDWREAANAFKDEPYLLCVKDDSSFGIFYAGYMAALENHNTREKRECPRCKAPTVTSMQYPEKCLVDDCCNCGWHSGLYQQHV